LMDNSGTAIATVMTTTPLTGGTHTITAQYLANGDANYLPSATMNPQFTYTVTAHTTTTTVTGASPSSSTFGTPVTFTATATPHQGIEATGTVQFFSDGTLIGTGPRGNSGGTATATILTAVDALTGGNHDITAKYLPGSDPNYQGSTSTPGIFTFNVQ